MRNQFLIDDDVRLEDGRPVIVEGPAEMVGNSFGLKPDNIKQPTAWRGSQWEHLILALAAQAVVGFVTGNWWAGAALSVGVFIGREHAQAEYMKDDVFLARYRKH